MMLTEEEAKTKRCCGQMGCGHPTTFQIAPDGYGAVPVPGNNYCIASQCMAWRYGPSKYEKLPPHKKETSPGHYVVAHNEKREVRQGLCGLAGKIGS